MVFALLAWRAARTAHELIALSVGSYGGLVFAGPYIAQHMFAVPLAEAIRAAPAEATTPALAPALPASVALEAPRPSV